MTENHIMQMQEGEMNAIRAIADGDEDRPLLMLNINRYTAESEYPDGEHYKTYIEVMQQTVSRVGGKVLWRTQVHGQPIGCDHDRADEILAIWYPSHQAFRSLRLAKGAGEMFERRQQCVANAVLHRCPGDQFPLQPEAS